MEYGEVVLDLRVRSTDSPAGYAWSERSSEPMTPPHGRLSPALSSNSYGQSPPPTSSASLPCSPPPFSSAHLGTSSPPHYSSVVTSPLQSAATTSPHLSHQYSSSLVSPLNTCLGGSSPSHHHPFSTSLGSSPPPGAAPASPPPSPGSPPPARPFKAFPRDPLALGGADEAYLRFRQKMLSRVRAVAPRPSARPPAVPPPTKNGPTNPNRDAAYWERRRKNNEAAKRSRDARRAKEDEIAIRAAFLERENLRLRYELAAVRRETASLRQAAALGGPSTSPPLLLSGAPQHMHAYHHHQPMGQLVVHH